MQILLFYWMRDEWFPMGSFIISYPDPTLPYRNWFPYQYCGTYSPYSLNPYYEMVEIEYIRT